MSEVRLYVGGKLFRGWSSVQISLSIESVCGSFNLSHEDRFSGQNEPWPIQDEDECRLAIDDDTVIEGFVDRRSRSMGGELSISGRDKAAALVDCAAQVRSFKSATVLEIATKLAAPYGISVVLQPGVTLPKPKLFKVNPGEKAHAAIDRAAKEAGVLVVSDRKGGIVLARSAGAGRADALVQGENIVDASLETDMTQRFHQYIYLSQSQGDPNWFGDATRIKQVVIDEGVKRANRVEIIRPEGGGGLEYARQRTAWEAKVRAAQSQVFSARVVGWRQRNGKLWLPNLLSNLTAPSLGGAGDLLITQVDFSLDSGSGEIAQLKLMRPDAFTPEPKVKKSGGGAWKELAKGAN